MFVRHSHAKIFSVDPLAGLDTSRGIFYGIFDLFFGKLHDPGRIQAVNTHLGHKFFSGCKNAVGSIVIAWNRVFTVKFNTTFLGQFHGGSS